MGKQKKQIGVFGKATVFKAPVKVGQDSVSITFPKTIMDYIHARDIIFWSPVNGVIQICGEQPHMVIPMISVNEDAFLPQDNAVPVVEIER